MTLTRVRETSCDPSVDFALCFLRHQAETVNRTESRGERWHATGSATQTRLLLVPHKKATLRSHKVNLLETLKEQAYSKGSALIDNFNWSKNR